MPDPMSSPANRALAAELRRLRERAGLSGDDVARALQWSASKISRIETNKTGIKSPDLFRLLEVYGVDQARRKQLHALAAEPEARGWWTAYADSIDGEYSAFISLEASATRLLWWSPELVTGLLQTTPYAAEIMDLELRSPDTVTPRTIRDRIEIRMRRQALLTEPDGKEFVFLLDEATLLRRHGSADIMRQQLDRIEQASRLPHVTIQVLAFAGLHPVANPGAFAILEFAPLHETAVGDIVYTERLLTSELVEDDETVLEYRVAFTRLSEAALSPDDSRELIARTARERWS